MPFNSSNVFTRLYNWVNDAAAGIVITPIRMDGDANDFAGGLTTVMADVVALQNMNISLATGSGSNSVGYKQGGTNSVATTVQSKLQQYLSIFDFLTAAQITDIQSGSPTLDHTVPINFANAASTAEGKALFWPAGTYQATNIPLIANQKWVGESSQTTILQLKSGTNANFITSPNIDCDHVWIENMTIDGNSAGNTSGDALTITGIKPRLLNLNIFNAAGQGIVTNVDVTEAQLQGGIEGRFVNIVIDSAQNNGWSHYGPNDSHFEDVIIIDAGIKTNNTYVALDLVAGTGNGRFFNCHMWNRSTTTNVPAISCYVQSGGNTFSGCHFEGGTQPLNISGNGNVFSDCAYYAPRGTYTGSITGGNNIVQGILGLTYYLGNPTYKGFLLGAGGVNNIIDLNNAGSGCTLGAIDFSSDAGENIIRLCGYQNSGAAYVGTPAATDDVTILVGGSSGAVFKQSPDIPWAAYTPTVTAATGAFTTVSATGSYTLIGKTCHFRVTVTDTTNGTAAGSMIVSLPFTSVSSRAFALTGRAIGISGSMLVGSITSSSTTCSVFTYNNLFPGSTGEIMVISGTYETA